MPVTKSELIEFLSNHSKLPRGTAEQIVNTIFDSMVAALVREERIEIRGFGSFEVRKYKAYQGRNPRTGEAVDVPPKKLPFFKVGKDLRERVNRGPQPASEAPPSEPASDNVIPFRPPAASEAAPEPSPQSPAGAPQTPADAPVAPQSNSSVSPAEASPAPDSSDREPPPAGF